MFARAWLRTYHEPAEFSSSMKYPPWVRSQFEPKCVMVLPRRVTSLNITSERTKDSLIAQLVALAGSRNARVTPDAMGDVRKTRFASLCTLRGELHVLGISGDPKDPVWSYRPIDC